MYIIWNIFTHLKRGHCFPIGQTVAPGPGLKPKPFPTRNTTKLWVKLGCLKQTEIMTFYPSVNQQNDPCVVAHMDSFTVTPTEPKAAVEVQIKPVGSQGSAPGHRRRLHPPTPPPPQAVARSTAVSYSFNTITGDTRLHFKSKEEKKA